jgi:hypothetical protein
MKTSHLFIIWLIILLNLVFSFRLAAQLIPCGQAFYGNSSQSNTTDVGYSHDLEMKIAEIVASQLNTKKQSVIIDIPVVVHVIHLGEQPGTGSNISSAQILGAIQGLNDRFKAVNGFGVDMQINFCLAVRDPNGNPTSGINRVNGSGVGNYQTDGMYALQSVSPLPPTCTDNDTIIKNLSKWPHTEYLNIWVVHKYCLAAGLSLYGQASGQRNLKWDGVTMLYSQMTATSITFAHEVGHMFLLNHTFQGDGTGSTCPVDTYCGIQGDLVCDTPPHRRGDFGTTNPCTANGIWNNSRFNYMSYSWASGPIGTFNENTCLFTQGQKDRARAAIYALNGYYVNSSGCMTSAATDAGIERIVYPVKTNYSKNCVFPNLLNAVVKLKNYGTASLNTTTIKYQVDNGPISSYVWNGSLLKDSSTNVTLPGILYAQGTHTFLAFTSNPNNASDGYGLNDSADVVGNYILQQSSTVTAVTALTNPSCFGTTNGSASVTASSSPGRVVIKEDWEGNTDWTIVNGSEPNFWTIGSATSYGGSKSMYITNNNTTYTYNVNAVSSVHLYKDFYFPPNATNIKIKFDWKCVGEQSAPFSGIDRLRVYLLDTWQYPFPSSQYGAPANYFLTHAIGSYHSQATWKTDSIMNLDGNAGLAKRIDFNWRNNASAGTQSPAAIDNIIISYDIPVAAGYTYSWTSTPVQTSSLASGLGAGNYSVTVTDANNCSTSVPLTLTQPNAVPVTAGTSSATICVGETATLSAAGALSYTWNTGAQGSSIAVAPSVTSTFTVTGSNAAGCNGIAIITQSVNTCATGIAGSLPADGMLRVYPNPNNGILIIERENDEPLNIRLMDAGGRRLLVKTLRSKRETVDLTDFAAGIYFIELYGQFGQEHLKLIRE